MTPRKNNQLKNGCNLYRIWLHVSANGLLEEKYFFPAFFKFADSSVLNNCSYNPSGYIADTNKLTAIHMTLKCKITPGCVF